MDISLVFRRGVGFSTFTGPGLLNFSKTVSAVFYEICGWFLSLWHLLQIRIASGRSSIRLQKQGCRCFISWMDKPPPTNSNALVAICCKLVYFPQLATSGRLLAATNHKTGFQRENTRKTIFHGWPGCEWVSFLPSFCSGHPMDIEKPLFCFNHRNWFWVF